MKTELIYSSPECRIFGIESGSVLCQSGQLPKPLLPTSETFEEYDANW